MGRDKKRSSAGAQQSTSGGVTNVHAGPSVVSRDVGCWMVSEGWDQSPGIV